MEKMSREQILENARKAIKGGYITLIKSRDLGNQVEKITHMHIRLGVSYANLSINANKKTGSLPWGHWVEGLENLVLEHKDKYYLRVTSTTPSNPGSGADCVKNEYFKNGVQISEEQALREALPSKIKSAPSPVYNVNFDNIISLGSEPEIAGA